MEYCADQVETERDERVPPKRFDGTFPASTGIASAGVINPDYRVQRSQQTKAGNKVVDGMTTSIQHATSNMCFNHGGTSSYLPHTKRQSLLSEFGTYPSQQMSLFLHRT